MGGGVCKFRWPRLSLVAKENFLVFRFFLFFVERFCNETYSGKLMEVKIS